MLTNTELLYGTETDNIALSYISNNNIVIKVVINIIIIIVVIIIYISMLFLRVRRAHSPLMLQFS